jgi:hypothetical protein
LAASPIPSRVRSITASSTLLQVCTISKPELNPKFRARAILPGKFPSRAIELPWLIHSHMRTHSTLRDMRLLCWKQMTQSCGRGSYIALTTTRRPSSGAWRSTRWAPAATPIPATPSPSVSSYLAPSSPPPLSCTPSRIRSMTDLHRAGQH